MKNYDLIIAGGGASGLNCAINAKKQNINKILVIEKNPALGGMLNLGNFNISSSSKITSKEYLNTLLEKYNDLNIETYLNTMVLNINDKGNVVCLSPDRGIEEISAKNIILTNGGKEKNKNPLQTAGDRCSGILSLFTAKNILNMGNIIPGKEIVIYGNSNLHIIEADIKKHNLNIVKIIDDNFYIKSISGNGRLDSITISDGTTDETIKCDTLIIAKGLASDGVVSLRSGLAINPETTGPKVDETYKTSKDNIYACGNGIFIHNSIEEIESETEKLISYIV